MGIINFYIFSRKYLSRNDLSAKFKLMKKPNQHPTIFCLQTKISSLPVSQVAFNFYGNQEPFSR